MAAGGGVHRRGRKRERQSEVERESEQQLAQASTAAPLCPSDSSAISMSWLKSMSLRTRTNSACSSRLSKSIGFS
ncbi:hypothetical protein EYF80_047936 [Liparis tanakae]|uniref:Uncharacterized protein n=1 Tax=Liparis tanakae TaxID=230148 RepID=A0A4Z2FNJ6_9TELE|nr:hypothetical protein EYF80_047936 [Liparis tanakae]